MEVVLVIALPFGKPAFEFFENPPAFIFSESLEIDHYKNFPGGTIGLEIEWNNKDPFYDRDLFTFRNLHNLNALSLGIIITRGASLQSELINVYQRYFTSLLPLSLNDQRIIDLISRKAQANIEKKLKKITDSGMEVTDELFVGVLSTYCLSSKFGQATTHMDKLKVRLKRGLGNPCPLLLIGIGSDRVVRSEI